MDLMIAPNLADQEMRTKESTGVTYWEGSVSVRGIKKNPITSQEEVIGQLSFKVLESKFT